MRPDRLVFSLRSALALAALMLCANAAATQVPAPAAGACKATTPQGVTPPPPAPDATTGIRIVATGPDGKPLQRKRFYLLQRSARAATATFSAAPRPPPRAANGRGGKPRQPKRFYLPQRSARAATATFSAAPRQAEFLQGASSQLREWLSRHDCDSLYCPEYEAEYAEAVKTVPEFKSAYEEGRRKYHNDKLALQWITVTFQLKNVRTEYYNRKRAWLDQAAQGAGKVASVMTDEKGGAGL